MALLRSHEYKQQQQPSTSAVADLQQPQSQNDERVQVRVGHAYPVTYATTMTMTSDNDDDATATNGGADGHMSKTDDTPTAPATTTMTETFLDTTDPMKWYNDHGTSSLETPSGGDNPTSKKKNKKGGDNSGSSQSTWKQFLLNTHVDYSSGVSHYGPSLIEHCLLVAGLWGTDAKFPSQLNKDEWQNLQTILKEKVNVCWMRSVKTVEKDTYCIKKRKNLRLTKKITTNLHLQQHHSMIRYYWNSNHTYC